MFSYDIKYLTTDELNVKTGDYKVRKYESKKKQEENIYELGKRTYCERRGEQTRAGGPHGLRTFESAIRDRSIVLCEWSADTLVTIVFSSGLLAYLILKPDNLEVQEILFDKYCVGKLSGQAVTSAIVSRSHFLFLHMEKAATLVNFNTKPAVETRPTRISDRNPYVQTIELIGGARRAERHLSWCESNSGIRVLAWSTSSSEPAPWSPISEDRANLHLYHIHGTHINLCGYHQLENETLSADLSLVDNNIVHIVEQITYQMNGVSLEWLRYEIPAEDGIRKLSSSRESVTQVALPAPARAVKRMLCDTRLLVGCIDGSLHVIHRSAGLTHSTRAGFIAAEVCLAGALIAVAEEKGRVQCFDRALSLLQHNAKFIDLAQHLREPRRMTLLSSRHCFGGSAVLASFVGGPLALLRIRHPRLPMGWIRSGRSSRAVALLRALDWDTSGEQCLEALQYLVHAALRKSLRGESEVTAQAALGAYMAPDFPLSTAAEKYAPAVHDLARKFFHHLLRRGRLDKALSLAVDLGAWDLFTDARWAALRVGNRAIAEEAHALALDYANAHRPDSSCSDSCSQCSSHTSSDTTSDEVCSTNDKIKPPPLPRVPPLSCQPTIMPVPISNPEPISTNSIRPNLHQYLERDLTIWNTDTTQPLLPQLPTEANPSIMKNSNKNNLLANEQQIKWRLRPNNTGYDTLKHENRLGVQYGNVFKVELKDESHNNLHSNMYRYHNTVNMVSDRSSAKHDRGVECRTRNNGERNKVKFSDTVTIAVVSEESCESEQSRELAESLPLCAPHAYLAAFTPAPRPTVPTQRDNPGRAATPKIKVVHFGMV